MYDADSAFNLSRAPCSFASGYAHRMRPTIRPGPLLLAVLLVSVAGAAAAQTADDVAREQYQSELAQQCPQKQLQMLSARELRDGLDDYKGGLPEELRDRLRAAEDAQCSSMDQGVDCVNNADIAAASQIGEMTNLAASICTDFIQCRDQAACDYAR
jgi:hypothetical protein